MPKYNKKEVLKEALKNYDPIFSSANENTKAMLNGEVSGKADVEKNINNPEIYNRYCLAKDIEDSKERKKAIVAQVQSLVIGNCPKKGNGSLDRILYTYMDDSGTPEALKNNIKTIQDYYNPSKRGQMIKDMMQKIAHADINKITESLADTTKALEFYHENTQLVDALFIADNMMTFGGENGVEGYDYHKDAEKMKGFMEIGGNFQTLSQKYGQAFIFNFKDPENISPQTAMQMGATAFPNGQDQRFKECLSGMMNFSGLVKDDNQIINQSIKEKGLNFENNFFKYKAVDKEGNEINFVSALNGSNKDAKIVERSENEKHIFDNLKVNETTTLMMSIDETRDYLVNSDMGKIIFDEKSLDSFAKLNTLNQKAKEFGEMKKPGFFARLFNTASNKAYKKAENEIKNIENDLINNDKLDKDFVNKIKTTENLKLNDLASDFVKQQSPEIENKSLNEPKREQIDVMEASEKNEQKISEAEKENINENQLNKETQVNNDSLSK